MSGPLLGWLVLMLQLDGVEMIYGGDAPRLVKGVNEGVCAFRAPWVRRGTGSGWAQVDPPAAPDGCVGQRSSRRPLFIGEDRDHTSSEPASYDDGTVP